jgi:hypothetical protein
MVGSAVDFARCFLRLANPISHSIVSADMKRLYSAKQRKLCFRSIPLLRAQTLGRKVSDEFTVPLCRGHHREVHRSGNEAFILSFGHWQLAWWQKAGIDPAADASVATACGRRRSDEAQDFEPRERRNCRGSR